MGKGLFAVGYVNVLYLVVSIHHKLSASGEWTQILSE